MSSTSSTDEKRQRNRNASGNQKSDSRHTSWTHCQFATKVWNYEKALYWGKSLLKWYVVKFCLPSCSLSIKILCASAWIFFSFSLFWRLKFHWNIKMKTIFYSGNNLQRKSLSTIPDQWRRISADFNFYTVFFCRISLRNYLELWVRVTVKDQGMLQCSLFKPAYASNYFSVAGMTVLCKSQVRSFSGSSAMQTQLIIITASLLCSRNLHCDTQYQMLDTGYYNKS